MMAGYCLSCGNVLKGAPQRRRCPMCAVLRNKRKKAAWMRKHFGPGGDKRAQNQEYQREYYGRVLKPKRKRGRQ